MPVTYRIFPQRNLVYVRFEGHALVADSFAALGAFAQDPDFRPGLNQLIDLTAVTGFQPDYLEVFRLQAAKAGIFRPAQQQSLSVYIAPGGAPLRLVRQILKSWEGIPGITHSVAESEAQALEILGMPEESVAQLMEQPA